MKMNPTFSLALQKLSHPLTLVAIGLVALNDLVLRPTWPSWWTGKFSDIGVIFFLPILIAALLAPLLGQRKKLTTVLAFGSVLAAFLILKASPLTNAWLTSWLPLRAVPDPSDLLVLPAWAAALALWLKPAGPVKSLAPRWRLLLLPLAALVTLADAAAPSYGIECFSVEGGSLHSHSMYNVMTSTDGGVTWHTETGVNGELCEHKESGEAFTLTSPKGVQYRGSIGGTVERSVDGQEWLTIYTPELLSEAEQTYLRKTVTSNFFYKPGPLDVVIDPSSGSLVLAMGLEGVLVIPEEGRAFWSTVGQYRHRALETDGFSAYMSLLSWELVLSFGAAWLWLVTALLRVRAKVVMIVLTVLGWVFVAGEGFALDPSLLNSSYTGMFSVLAVIFTSLWILGLLIATIIRLRRRPAQLLWRIFFVLMITVFLFVPYMFWSFNVLPAYWMAQAGAGGLALVFILLGVLTAPRRG